MNWTEERCEQLNALRRLLYDVAGLNSTTNVIGHMQKCIASAEALTAWDMGRTVSFAQFLCDLAHDERSAAQAAPTPAEREA